MMTNEERENLFSGRILPYLVHLPTFYHDVAEFQAIAAAIDPELEVLSSQWRNDFVESFILEASGERLKGWEEEIGIRADPLTETDAIRRKRLILRYTTKPPFTIRWLRIQLQQLLGTGFQKVERDGDIEALLLHLDVDALSLWEDIVIWLEMVVPLSMQFGVSFTGHKELPSKLYVGSAHPMHLHIEIQPA